VHAFFGSSTVSRIVGAVTALWLSSAGPALAGGGGEDAGTFQSFLGSPNGSTGLCSLLGMTSCPQLPTLTQIVLQIAALENSPPDLVRSPQQQFAPVGGLGICTVAGNFQSSSGVGLPVCSQANGINAINPPAPSVSLSDLRPLAFMPTTGTGQAVPVPAGIIGANSFFYAAATKSNGQPDTLFLTYDYPPLTGTTFPKGLQVAAISLPLVILNSDGTERPVATTLQISAACNGGTQCLTANAVGNFSGSGTQKRSPADLGVQWALVFGISPNSSQPHAIFQVQAPLVVTGPTTPADASACQIAIEGGKQDVQHCGNDPAYFGVVPFGATANGAVVGFPTDANQVSGLPTVFTTSVLGHPTAFLKGASDGIAPYAAPPAVAGAKTSTFGFCASFWGGSAATQTLNPAVAAFLSIGTDGTTYVSAPVAPSATVTCPF